VGVRQFRFLGPSVCILDDVLDIMTTCIPPCGNGTQPLRMIAGRECGGGRHGRLFLEPHLSWYRGASQEMAGWATQQLR
jgi:hypothetical protein